MTYPHDTRRRESNKSATARLTGLTVQQLAVQLTGGLMLAAIVGLSSSWATQQVMGEQLRVMSHQIEDLRRDVRQMRQDLYAPRYRSSQLDAMATPLPPGRP